MEDEYYFIPEIHYYKEEDLNHYRNEKQKRLKLPNKNCAGKTNSAITNGFFESFTDKIYYDYIPYIPCNYKPLEIKKELYGECVFKSCSCKKFVVKEDIKCKACTGYGYHESHNQICLCDCVEGKDD